MEHLDERCKLKTEAAALNSSKGLFTARDSNGRSVEEKWKLHDCFFLQNS